MLKILLTTLLSLFFAHSHAGATGIVNMNHIYKNQNTSSGASINVTLTVSPAVGNLMVLGVSYWNAGAPTMTISDNKGNTWHQLGSTQNDIPTSHTYISLYYAVVTVAGATSVTITPSSNSWLSAIYAEFSGVNATTPTDGSVGAAPTSTKNADSGALTPTQSGDLLVCVAMDNSDGSVGVSGAGYTSLGGYGDANNPITMEFRIYNNTSAIHGTMTFGVTFTLPTILGAFAPASARVSHRAINQ